MLFNNGKSATNIVNEYGVARSTLHKWTKNYNNTKSFKANDNRTNEEVELIKVKKENKYLKMENDILKQAALILGRK
jgi:transposase-like protein